MTGDRGGGKGRKVRWKGGRRGMIGKGEELVYGMGVLDRWGRIGV